MNNGLGIGLMAGAQLFQGISESSALNAQAGVDMENARRTEMQGAIDAEAASRRGRAVQGEAIAALAGSGGQVGTGSALDLIRQNAIEAEMDVLNRRYDAASKAASLRTDAAMKRASATSALFGGVLRAGAAAVTGLEGMKNAAALRAAQQHLWQVQMPGGQQLPMPHDVQMPPPMYNETPPPLSDTYPRPGPLFGKGDY